MTRRTTLHVEGELEAQNLGRTLGREVRDTRRRRRMIQTELGRRVGLSRSRISEVERGGGTTLTLEMWVRIGMALGRPVGISLARDLLPVPIDAGHLDGQELVLRLVRATGRTGAFELPTRPGPRSPSADIAVRDDRARMLLLIEIWNRFDDVGRGARSTDGKVQQTEDLAIAIGYGRPYRVASCWLLVDSAANRALVARYSAVLRTRFPGSSRAWATALSSGGPIPARPGICWLDLRTRRIVPMRSRPRPG
jgi:transcriptional regulator with XRE-family HTH domain